jgi:hypothetical protein
MKVGKPSGNDVKNAAAVAGGVFVGTGVSNGLFTVIHDEDKAITDAEEKKKHDNMGLIKRAGIAVVFGFGASAIKSNDVISLIAKGLCYGITGDQAFAILKSFSRNNDSVKKMAASNNKAERAIAATLGLGCACDSQKTYIAEPLNGRRRRRKGLGIPVVALETDYASVMQGQSNVFEQAIDSGRMLSSAQ